MVLGFSLNILPSLKARRNNRSVAPRRVHISQAAATLAVKQEGHNLWKKINYSYFKLYWRTFSAPNASYSKKYLSQFFIKMTIKIWCAIALTPQYFLLSVFFLLKYSSVPAGKILSTYTFQLACHPMSFFIHEQIICSYLQNFGHFLVQ